jgi:hypothetical protein
MPKPTMVIKAPMRRIFWRAPQTDDGAMPAALAGARVASEAPGGRPAELDGRDVCGVACSS